MVYDTGYTTMTTHYDWLMGWWHGGIVALATLESTTNIMMHYFSESFEDYELPLEKPLLSHY